MKFKKTILLVILFIWYAAFASLWSQSANMVALYVVLPIAFFVCFFQPEALKPNIYFKLLLALLIWIAISYLWAKYKVPAGRQLKQLLGTFILCYIYNVISKNEKAVPYLYITYLILFIGAVIYAKQNILGSMDSENSRLNDDKLNANTLAYLLFYLTFAIYELGTFAKRRLLKVTLDFAFLLTIPITFIVALLTASRQVFIVQIPLIAILLYLRYLKQTRTRTKLLFLLFTLVCAVIVAPYVTDIYEDSYLKKRNEIEIKDDARVILLHDAIEVGMRYFPFGVGPGNYVYHSPRRNFSHNVYAELFANEGIVGLILYVWMMMLFVVRQVKRYYRYKDKQYLCFLLFGVIYIFDGFFFVFYPYLWLMGAFILVASHSEVYYSNRVNEIKSIQNSSEDRA